MTTNWLSTGETTNRLIYDSLKNRSRKVFFCSPLINQRLDIRLNRQSPTVSTQELTKKSEYSERDWLKENGIDIQRQHEQLTRTLIQDISKDWGRDMQFSVHKNGDVDITKVSHSHGMRFKLGF